MNKEFTVVEEMITDEDFLAWYFKTSSNAVQSWEHWMSEDPARQAMTEKASMTLKSLIIAESETPEAQIESARKRLMLSVAEHPDSDAKVVRMNSRKKWLWIAAASITIIAGVLAFAGLGGSKPTIETTFGEIKQKELPDGSYVFLNANSTVEYDEKWSADDDREVWIKGEAFFKVAKTSSNNRFIVHTSAFDIIVTGTQFNVVDRNNRNNVALTEGSITINTKDGKTYNLQPGDYFEVSAENVVQKTIETEKVIAWQKKKIMLDNTPLKDLVRDMEALYDVNVILENDIVGKKPLTGIMPNDNLEVLLNALEATGDFRIARNGKEIKISLP